MSFYETYKKWREFDFGEFFADASEEDIIAAISADNINEQGYLNLLSPLAEKYLEPLAQKSQRLTRQYFGSTIGLYTPIYVSDHCVNECSYCGFRAANKSARRKLTLPEVEEEAGAISSSGFRHILMLTGESRTDSSPEYIKECAVILRKYFSLVSMEVYPFQEEEYRYLISAGVDGLTIYQEVYDEDTYSRVHKSGPKKNYLFRLDAPERAAKSGMHVINIGSLLGLFDWRREAFFVGLHAEYLQDRYPGCEISVSTPRLCQINPDFSNPEKVYDKNIVQFITALRLFLPRLGITLSTREEKNFRDNLISLGITRMSAASSTVVGGRLRLAGDQKNLEQFEIADTRSLEDVKGAIVRKGYQPVMKDWVNLNNTSGII